MYVNSKKQLLDVVNKIDAILLQLSGMTAEEAQGVLDIVKSLVGKNLSVSYNKE